MFKKLNAVIAAKKYSIVPSGKNMFYFKSRTNFIDKIRQV